MAIFKVNPTSGIDQLMERSLLDLRDLGSVSKNLRTGSETKEIIKYTISSSNPVDRIIRNKERKNNLVAQIAETAWVLSGSRNLKYLSPFLPRAVDFSDDGENWRAGYGRVSNIKFTPPEDFFVSSLDKDNCELFFSESSTRNVTINQIRNVVNILTEDPSSRQAFIAIALPGDNLVSNTTKDTPCTLNIQFLIREGELHCIVFMRSNDCIWGLTGINYFEWTFLQEVIAGILDVKVGTYDHTAGSFHIYERHYETVDKILLEYPHVEEFIPSRHVPLNVSSMDSFENSLKTYMSIFDSILTKQVPLELCIKNLGEFLGEDSNLHKYLALPLLQALFKIRGVSVPEIHNLFLNFDSDSYLWRGILKSNKFFFKGFFNK